MVGVAALGVYCVWRDAESRELVSTWGFGSLPDDDLRHSRFVDEPGTTPSEP
ncbi:MAG: hypothetical protein JJE52_09120 [Acidimicrobiia bacterium]|nr:hypothetical protein [Acidimicrobiia bacterium]